MSAADELVAEVEAFLSGHVGEVVVGQPIADESWVAVNWLAHAAPDELVAATCRARDRRTSWGSWPWAIDIVLRELVAAADAGPDRIARLQRAHIVPYELTLMAEPNRATMPVDVVAEVVSDLRNSPSGTDRG